MLLDISSTSLLVISSTFLLVISSEVEKSIYSIFVTNSPICFLTPCIGEGWLSSVG